MWGNGVKITGTANHEEGILHLCEVQIYAETYGKMLDNHVERQIAALAIVKFRCGFFSLFSAALVALTNGDTSWINELN